MRNLAQFFAASPLFSEQMFADRKYSDPTDALHEVVNIFDFGRLAKAKMDPLAWDYVDEGSEDEASLKANRAGFEDLIIRPHFLDRDVSHVDVSTTLFGKKTAAAHLPVPDGWQKLRDEGRGEGNCDCRRCAGHDDGDQWRDRRCSAVR